MTSNPAVSETRTKGVRVRVESRYLPDQMPGDVHEKLFGYRITISNESEHTVRLLRRHWTIIDADGYVEHVDGPGVIGQQPSIAPGESYTYGSFCPLQTDWGTMEGDYDMVDDQGEEFSVAIARFHLFVPREALQRT